MRNFLLAGLVGLAKVNAQNAEIVVNQPSMSNSEGVIFSQDGENHQVSYLDRDFSDDDLNVTCSANNMCIQLKKQFLRDEGITNNFDGIHLKSCDQESEYSNHKLDQATHTVVILY
jgi:hypothetical protein